MKKVGLLFLGILLLVSSLLSQSLDALTADQKKEYNRRKLTVEKVTESSGGMGWYWGFFSKKIDTWRAFKGLANQIEAEEFFRITGYIEEADKVKKNIDDSNGKITLGVVLYGGGLVAMLVPKTETVDLGYGVDYEELSYPFLVPGTIASLVGVYFWYDGMLKKLKPVAPYQSAFDIAEEYNKSIIQDITK